MTKVCTVTGCDRPFRARGMCNSHYRAARAAGMPTLPTRSASERFWEKVDQTDACWIWLGARHRLGYGQLRGESGKLVYAHRYSYELAEGKIPDGLVLDHLCRTPECVNPRHLEPVPQRINVLRGASPDGRQSRQTHCKRGHEFTLENTLRHGGKRRCRECFNSMRRVS